MFRVIIAGGRDYNNYAQLERAMDRLLSNITDEIVIVCGMARGADTLGEQYGKQRGYRINYFPADWKTPPIPKQSRRQNPKLSLNLSRRSRNST